MRRYPRSWNLEKLYEIVISSNAARDVHASVRLPAHRHPVQPRSRNGIGCGSARLSRCRNVEVLTDLQPVNAGCDLAVLARLLDAATEVRVPQCDATRVDVTNSSFEETLIEVWRQSLVANATVVELDGSGVPVRRLPDAPCGKWISSSRESDSRIGAEPDHEVAAGLCFARTRIGCVEGRRSIRCASHKSKKMR